jgi:tripartite-type tricarboxylate transporter receptor subunit TctC
MEMSKSLVLALLLTMFAANPASTQDFPSRPVTLVVALAAGTGMDAVVRLYGERLAKSLGQPVIVENKPGAAGVVTVEAIKGAPADGHTLAAATSSIMAIRPSLFKKPPYDPRTDFVPIALYLKSPFILVVNPDLPARSVPDLITYIRQRPGQISYSSSSIGGAPHLTTEYLKQQFSLDISHVPYKNSPQSIADVAAGHVSLAFAEAGASLPLIKAGKLRALAVTSLTRLPSLPDVPPLAEAASVADFEAVSWHVLFAMAGTPHAIVDKLHSEMVRIMSEPAMKSAIEAHGLIPQAPQSVDATRAYISAEIAKWGNLAKSLGLAGTI